jgi:hypothetical protein
MGESQKSAVTNAMSGLPLRLNHVVGNPVQPPPTSRPAPAPGYQRSRTRPTPRDKTRDVSLKYAVRRSPIYSSARDQR